MNNQTIQNLREALEFSPENLPLRLHLADMMMQEGLYEDAAVQYQEVLNRSYGDNRAQLGLAASYYKQQKYSAAIVVYEQAGEDMPEDALLTYVRCLIREQSIRQASDVYQKILAVNPGFRDEEIDGFLRMPGGMNPGDGMPEFDDEFSEGGSGFFMERPDIGFADVGGMQKVKNEISLKIIQPLKNPDLYKAFGKKAGGGILLYGPPGCGKTFIAKATAGEISAKFIAIGLHDILDMWIGNSEKNLHEVFSIARQNQPCVLFFDEVDALGASRADLKQSGMRHVINQFLAELDGVESDNEGVLILAATNAPWSIDPAFRRPGRFDRIIFVAPPDQAARAEILQSLLRDKPVKDIDFNKIAQATPEYSGADLKALVDIAIEQKITESFSSGTVQPLVTKDLQAAIKQHRPTTTEWFATARNYALYANETGLYDEILHYLKIKK